MFNKWENNIKLNFACYTTNMRLNLQHCTNVGESF